VSSAQAEPPKLGKSREVVIVGAGCALHRSCARRLARLHWSYRRRPRCIGRSALIVGIPKSRLAALKRTLTSDGFGSTVCENSKCTPRRLHSMRFEQTKSYEIERTWLKMHRTKAQNAPEGFLHNLGQTQTFVVRECQAHSGHSHHSAFHPLPHRSRCKLGQSGSINSEEMK
jgi:hypothetical protein